VQNELLVESYASCFLNGPIYCNGQLYASGGLTGATGSFGSLKSTTLLNVGGAGSFGSLSTNRLNVGGTKFSADSNGNATTQNLTATGTTSLQALTATSMTLNNIAMPTPAFLRANLVSTGIGASSNVSMSWSTGSSSIITVSTTLTYKITVPDVGSYLFGGKINVATAITSIKVVALQTSTNDGGSYSTVMEWKEGSTPVGGDFVLAPYIHTTTVANQAYQVKFNNDSGAFLTFNNSTILSFLTICRIA
jgi:hypothetical protein